MPSFVDIVIQSVDKASADLNKTAGGINRLGDTGKKTAAQMQNMAASAIALAGALKMGWQIGVKVVSVLADLTGKSKEWREQTQAIKRGVEGVMNVLDNYKRVLDDIATKSENAFKVRGVIKNTNLVASGGVPTSGASDKAASEDANREALAIGDQIRMRTQMRKNEKSAAKAAEFDLAINQEKKSGPMFRSLPQAQQDATNAATAGLEEIVKATKKAVEEGEKQDAQDESRIAHLNDLSQALMRSAKAKDEAENRAIKQGFADEHVKKQLEDAEKVRLAAIKKYEDETRLTRDSEEQRKILARQAADEEIAQMDRITRRYLLLLQAQEKLGEKAPDISFFGKNVDPAVLHAAAASGGREAKNLHYAKAEQDRENERFKKTLDRAKEKFATGEYGESKGKKRLTYQEQAALDYKMQKDKEEADLKIQKEIRDALLKLGQPT